MYKILFVIMFTLLSPTFSFAQQGVNFIDDTVGVPSWSTSANNFLIEGNNYETQPSSDYTNASNVNINVTSQNSSCTVVEKSIKSYVDYFGCIIRVAVFPFMLTLALLTFLWGVTILIRNPNEKEARKKGHEVILYGIIGFFVIISVYALVSILTRTVGFGSNFKDDATSYNQLKDKIRRLK